MDDDKLLLGRIKDLARRADENNYVTHTDFLSRSELHDVLALCAAEGMITGENRINGVEYCIYGGVEDPDRGVICLLPSYLDACEFLAQDEGLGDIVSCILIEPANRKFADELTHRDYLGSLMNLGIERNRIGDIRSDDSRGFVFVMSEVAGLICDELCRIRHTTVKCSIVPASACDIVPKFKEIEGTVSSERIDAILALVFRLSRNKAQDLIASESVIIDGKTITSPAVTLKQGMRVSVRGHGKFEYDELQGSTRKGRLSVKIKLFA